MDWLFETPWTLWVALALVFAVIEMLSLDLFFLMLAISAGITAAISPLFWFLVCARRCSGSSINQPPVLSLMLKLSLVLRCASPKM